MPSFADAKKTVAGFLQRHPPSLGLRRTGIDATAPPSRLLRRASRKIDQLVYKLYGLTAKEIRIVEEATRL